MLHLTLLYTVKQSLGANGCPINATTPPHTHTETYLFLGITENLATRKSTQILWVFRKLQPNFVRQNKFFSCIPRIQENYWKNKQKPPCIMLRKLCSCKIPSFPLVIHKRNNNSRGKHYVPCNMAALLHFCRMEMVRYLLYQINWLCSPHLKEHTWVFRRKFGLD